jgi:hypothetical protein
MRKIFELRIGMIMDQEQEYRNYIRKHRANVKSAFVIWREKSILGSVLFNEESLFNMEQLIDTHDLSKYSKEEFEAYRKEFFPIDGETSDKKEFSMAWNHHQKSNPHHWQYWVLPKKIENEAIPIPMCYVVEMLCDWTAMSFQKGGSVTEWFESELPKMIIHEKTKETIRNLISEFEEILIEMRKF